MIKGFKCGFARCTYFNENKILVKNHEKECKCNPVKKGCESCNNYKKQINVATDTFLKCRVYYEEIICDNKKTIYFGKENCDSWTEFIINDGELNGC